MNRIFWAPFCRLICLALLIGGWSGQVFATKARSAVPLQKRVQQSSKLPLHITSKSGIDCDRESRKCIAKENVKVSQGGFVMFCDRLTAYLYKNKDGKDTVKRIDAQGNIRFKGAEFEKGAARRALYDVETGLMTLTGVHQTSPGDGNTACVNRWWPTVQLDDRLVCAQVIHLKLDPSPQARQKVREAQTFGGTLFSTPSELSQSETAHYDILSQQIVLEGDVVLDRAEGQVKGPYAQLDLSTRHYEVLKADSPQEKSFVESDRPKALIRIKNIDRKALKPAK